MENSEPVRLARYAIEERIRNGRVPSIPEWVSRELRTMMAGCFVSIHKSDGALRGCIGTLSPVTASLASEIIQNAVSSATRDPRFPPVEAEELDELEITVDVLGEAEATTAEELDPKRYGVIVQHGWKKGVLLPDLEGVDTVDEQLRIALMKAGIGKSESYRIYRFTVRRYH